MRWADRNAWWIFLAALLAVYGLVGSWDVEDQERIEADRIWTAKLPSADESRAVNAAYLRGRHDGAMAMVRKARCQWQDLFRNQ